MQAVHVGPARVGAVLLVSVTLVSGCLAQSIDDQIRAEIARYVTTVNRGDPRAVADLYLNDDGASTVGDGTIHRGWQAVAALLRDAYAQFGSIEMAVDSVTVMALGNDAALAVMKYRWALGGTNPQTLIGAMTLVYVRTPDGWRVAHDHTSTLEAFEGSSGPLGDSGPGEPVRQTTTCTVTRIIDGDTIECPGRWPDSLHRHRHA